MLSTIVLNILLLNRFQDIKQIHVLRRSRSQQLRKIKVSASGQRVQTSHAGARRRPAWDCASGARATATVCSESVQGDVRMRVGAVIVYLLTLVHSLAGGAALGAPSLLPRSPKLLTDDPVYNARIISCTWHLQTFCRVLDLCPCRTASQYLASLKPQFNLFVNVHNVRNAIFKTWP